VTGAAEIEQTVFELAREVAKARRLGLEYGPVKFQGKTTRCVLVPREVVEQS